MGAPTSLYYNIYVAESVTRSARSYISHSVMFFESFLANNVKFNSVNEIMTFIYNIIHEKDNRQFDDSVILDRNIYPEEVFARIMNIIDPLVWIPTEKQMSIVWDRILHLSQEDLNRVFYKNNLIEFCDLSKIKKAIIEILCTLDEPFMNPNKPPENIIDKLDALLALIKEYVYYKYPFIDKLDRIEYMMRDVVCISDTDSTIISFDGLYRFILDFVYNIPMKIKQREYKITNLIKTDEDGIKEKRQIYTLVKPEYDYNFYTDEIIEIHKLRKINTLIPQESLKYAIINIFGYICSDLIVDYLDYYCKLANSNKPGRPCLLNMKTEFYFESLMITESRKNYADIQTMQEGKMIPKTQKAQLDIKGLPINKSTLSAQIKQQFQDILYEDILMTPRIDQVKIIKKLVMIEKEIVDSILRKETKYYKPGNVAAIGAYKDPMSQNGVKACLVYNELRTGDMPIININERNSIYKVKVNITKENIHTIREEFPEVYAKLVKLYNHPILGGSKLNTIGFPIDTPVPDWIMHFVDIKSIVNDNLSNFPLGPIGIQRLDNDSVNYTNNISF